MKLSRRELRRLIESVLNEYKDYRMPELAQAELQKTYDWFVNVVFPAVDANKWPIIADDDYAYTYWVDTYVGDTPNIYALSYIDKGTRWDSIDGNAQNKDDKGRGTGVDDGLSDTSLPFLYKILVGEEQIGDQIGASDPEIRAEIKKELSVKMNSVIKPPDEFTK